MGNIIKILKTQISAQFSGNIVLQDVDNSQFLGKISLKDGKILNAETTNIDGYRALRALAMLFEEQKSEMIVEPEVVEGKSVFSYQTKEVMSRLEEDISFYRKIKRLRPPGHLQLMVKKNLGAKDKNILPDEIDLLDIISDYGFVKDIYENSDLLEFEVTMGLVKLREKDIIEVIT